MRGLDDRHRDDGGDWSAGVVKEDIATRRADLGVRITRFRCVAATVGTIGLLMALPSAVQAAGFTQPTNYGVGKFPVAVALRDFNHDGHLDLIAANQNSHTLTERLGQADGKFGSASTYDVPNGAGGDGGPGIAVGDFNHDGDPDLAVCESGSASGGHVAVFLGGAAGTFHAPGQYLVDPANATPNGLAVGDFNHDGKLDLATANSDVTASVLLGAGNGGFGPPTIYDLGSGAWGPSIATDDFNGDGRPDLAVSVRAEATGSVSTLLGTKTGAFGKPTAVSTRGAGADFVAADDFNGDGDPDLATANGNSTNVSVLMGGAGGHFGTGTTYDIGGVNAPSWYLAEIATADFNGDGDPDLAVAATGNGNRDQQIRSTVAVLHGQAGGKFGAATNYPVGKFPTAVAAGDLNGDKLPDLVVANGRADNVSVLLDRSGHSRPG